MKKFSSLLLFAVFFVFIPQPSFTAQGSVQEQLRGEWASDIWYGALLATKSPCAAAAACENLYLTHIIFGQDPDHPEPYIAEIVINCGHEGDYRPIERIELKENKYLLWMQDELVATVEFIDPDHISFDWKAFKEEYSGKYVRVPGTINSFVNDTLLAGRYLDRNGNKYSFNSNGDCVWDNKDLKYEILLDYVLDDCDLLMVRDGQKQDNYGFKIEGKKILIYKTKDNNEGSLIWDGLPISVLTPIK